MAVSFACGDCPSMGAPLALSGVSGGAHVRGVASAVDERGDGGVAGFTSSR
jgi:hypothetical protein